MQVDSFVAAQQARTGNYEAIASHTDREFDIHEMLWNCEMARYWLENHWKHLGKGYDLPYKQREKKAEWHIDFALMVANNAKW